eukprot:scaffold82841_cov63-Cyclotella_meneghiniana.AAC.1
MFVADTVWPVRCQLGQSRGAVGMEWYGDWRMNGEGGVVGCLLGYANTKPATLVSSYFLFGSPLG